MKKQLLLIIFLVSIILTGCSIKKVETPKSSFDEIQKRGYLIVGVKDNTKPFGFKNEKNEYQGFDIDLAKEISLKLLKNDNVQFKTVTPANRITKLNSKEVDIVIATMTNTPQRQLVVNFSQPYYYTGLSILTKRGTSVKSIYDLNHEKVIVILGSTAEDVVRHYAHNAIIQGAKDYEDAYKLLKANKAIAIVADLAILYGIKNLDNNLAILPKLYSKEAYAIAMRKGEYDEVLKNKINSVLDDLIETNKINSISKKWLSH